MKAARVRLSGKAVRARTAAKLQPVNDELELLRAHESDLRVDVANLAEALAECTWLLDRCTPGRFRDRELAPRIRAFSALAGKDAYEKVLARVESLPTLGTPTSATDPACSIAPPEMYAATHAPCCWPEGHAGDHLWKALAFDVTGRSE